MTNIPVWEEGGWAGLGSLGGSVETDLCVIGLGGSGLSAVEEGLEAGLDVVGIDAGMVAGEAAGRNGGFLLAGLALFYNEAVARWGEAARRVYRMSLDELDRIMSQPAARRVGSLRIADTDAELADIGDELSALRAHGFEAHPYDGPEGEGILLPGDGVCNPLRRCRDMVGALLNSGVSLFEGTRATKIGTGRVETKRGVIEASHIVVAVDGRLERLFPRLKGDVRTARLEMLATEPVLKRYDRPVYKAYGYIYWQQLANGSIALGGLRDRFAEHSWTMTPGPSPELQGALDGYLAELGVDAAVTHRWAGHAAYTPDRVPIYTEIDPGVWVVGGYCGHGNVLGSVYARAAVRSAVAGEREPLL